MRRWAARILAASCGLLLAAAAWAVPVETTTGLNLRAGPGVGYRVIATMPAGEVVDLRGCDGAWCVVAYRGALGWASGRYLARIPFRPSTRRGLFDWLAPPRERVPVERLAPPPPGGAAPRVIERPAPRPAPTQRARPQPERSAPTASPPSGSGVLTGATPTVTVPRSDEAEPDGTSSTEAGRDTPPQTRSAGDEPSDASRATQAEPEEEVDEDEMRRRRRAPTGGSGADVL
ncbi:SH3 domain-containing protein [Salinarimonas sp.]|uniref:SH3 domain-containing protein n=1 Tax=Salinarimonas sp. TaxID=2766526 RepID=UPI0032D966BD